MSLRYMCRFRDPYLKRYPAIVYPGACECLCQPILVHMRKHWHLTAVVCIFELYTGFLLNMFEVVPYLLTLHRCTYQRPQQAREAESSGCQSTATLTISGWWPRRKQLSQAAMWRLCHRCFDASRASTALFSATVRMNQ